MQSSSSVGVISLSRRGRGRGLRPFYWRTAVHLEATPAPETKRSFSQKKEGPAASRGNSQSSAAKSLATEGASLATEAVGGPGRQGRGRSGPAGATRMCFGHDGLEDQPHRVQARGEFYLVVKSPPSPDKTYVSSRVRSQALFVPVAPTVDATTPSPRQRREGPSTRAGRERRWRTGGV